MPSETARELASSSIIGAEDSPATQRMNGRTGERNMQLRDSCSVQQQQQQQPAHTVNYSIHGPDGLSRTMKKQHIPIHYSRPVADG